MNNSPAVPGEWTRGRFLSVVGVLFVLQAGLILLFAERGHSASRPRPSPGQIRVLGAPLTADQLTTTFFALDPTVFPLPGLHGFSERAWLSLPEPKFDAPSETESPAWLAMDTTRLGTNFPLATSRSALASGLPDPRGQEVEPWPVFLPPEAVRTQSTVEIRGPLAQRQLNLPAELPPASSAQLLSNSVVQIAVDSSGQVVAARLLGRSGSVEADNDALAKARNFRFRPGPAPAPIWGRAIFAWQTAEPTNARPPAPLGK